MSLPVSHYEALLAEVRDLRRKTQRVQQLANPLISQFSTNEYSTCILNQAQENPAVSQTPIEVFLSTEKRQNVERLMDMQSAEASGFTDDDDFAYGISNSTSISVSSEPIVRCDRKFRAGDHGTWPTAQTMWNSDPATGELPTATTLSLQKYDMPEIGSVMSFASSAGGIHIASPSLSRRSSQQLEAKVDMVYSLLAMLSGQEHADMGDTLLALSTNPESCLAMRHSGCIPLLVQMVQSDREADVRKKAMQALNNLVHSQPDEKLRKREVRILKLLEQTREYTEFLLANFEYSNELEIAESEDDKHPVQTVAHLMKLSFDELHRQAICFLGGIHTIATLVEVEYIKHLEISAAPNCILLRRYACMALTNLTFGDSGNKALLCSYREFIRALVIQLASPSDELRQVTASVLRNLSWRADASSKEVLREIGCVTGLMNAAMLLDNKENTLKSILSALWNLSAHCTENKSEICSVNGALGFLVNMLTYKTPSKSLAVIENSGGILRNISSQIAVREDYREILRQHNCLEVLLAQLKSPSLTIVSNACGTLWNLSAKCQVDQERLWQLGAPAMLRSLNHSKHKMIAMGSSAALKNLLAARPTQPVLPIMDATALAMDLPVLPTLGARKQRALLQDLDRQTSLSETYENIEKDEPSTSFNYYERTNFTKSTRNLSSVDEEYRTLSTNTPATTTTDSGVQSLDIAEHSSLNSLKFKEGSACSDEKDRCSIEDISDDQSSSDQNKCYFNDEWSFDDLISRKEVLSSSFTSSIPQIFPNRKSMNETLHKAADTFHFEKHDLEKNKSMESNRTLNAGTGIPLPRNYSSFTKTTPNNNDVKKNVRSSLCGLPRKCLTSTPIHLSNATSNLRDNSSIETYKMQSIDTVDFNDVTSISDVVPAVVSETDDSLVESGMELSITNHQELELSSEKAQPNTLEDISPPENKSLDCCPYQNTNTYDFGTDARDHLLERSCEENQPVDNRMLDPDAMIESLDRFTAELVSHASHLQNNKDNNTWNDDSSPNEITFPSISGSAPNVITFSDCSEPKPAVEQQPISNDFSSLDTSTMSTSTLIAIEASKMASVFKSEAEMTSSFILEKQELLSSLAGSPKLTSRKQSLPKAAVLRQALGSLTNGSSLESLENHSLLALDEVNPPSAMGELFDSITSISSLPYENQDSKPEFIINGDTSSNQIDVSSSFLPHQSYFNSITDLENINPPSILNDITDLCNSLADVCTDAIGTETEIFEDCQTHLLQTEDDVTEFSDAHSATPIQSDISSPEEQRSPAKTKSRLAQLKHRRKLGGDRYKTYTLSAPSLPSESTQSEHFQTCSSTVEDKICVAPKPECETKIVNSRSKLSIRQNFIQKRLQNRDRFKTHTIEGSILQTQAPTEANSDLQSMVEREANLVLKSLRETKTGDELLDSETLSLVSNDDDSDRNSASPINYKTYHKGWGLKKNIPIIEHRVPDVPEPDEAPVIIPEPDDPIEDDPVDASKPKVVKPPAQQNEQPKGIRGRRKPLYYKSPKPATTAPVLRLPKPKTTTLPIGTKPAATASKAKPLERQGTFTKPAHATGKNTATTSKNSTTSKIPAKARPHSSISSDRSTTKIPHVNYLRSTSADSKEAAMKKRQNQGLKPAKTLPAKANEASTVNSPMKKQVTSKIASLWKKIEENKVKQQTAKKDTRVWIGGNATEADTNARNGVTLRKHSTTTSTGKDKRISRLGSFIVVDEAEDLTAN